MNKNTGGFLSLFHVVNYLVMTLLGVLFIYPLVYTVSLSLSNAGAILSGRVFLLPQGFNLNAYKALFQDKTMLTSFIYTVKLTIFGVIASIVMTTLAAYPLSRRNLKGGTAILYLIVFTMYFSGGIIPNYLVIKNLKLIDTMGSLIMPAMINTFNLIIMINYFRGLPVELEEAAKVEGCSNFGVLWRVFIPLSKPILATLTIFYAVEYWNSFFSALMYIQSPEKYPLQIKLYQILNVFSDNLSNQTNADVGSQVVIPENLKSAAVVVTVMPIIFVYPWLQKYFIKGVTIGAIKG
jgi:putative aldouronate transport system permease protein